MKKSIAKAVLTFLAISPLIASFPGSANAYALQPVEKTGQYLPGDLHQHTLYTDGRVPFAEVMAQNADHGLAWWANSEHGGYRNRDGNGNYWDDPEIYQVNPILGDIKYSGDHQAMWRWQSLRDFVYPDIQNARSTFPDKSIISGFEWNPPGHEHSSVSIYQNTDVANAISEFEYRFDAYDSDTSRNGENSLLPGFQDGMLTKTNVDQDDSILAVEWMQELVESGHAKAWIIPTHIERKWKYSIEDFRNWMDAGPDVAIGFEGAPGHQAGGDRGFGRSSLGGGTYGGTGFFVSQIGGLWDGLLAEGRRFFNFASSDFHMHWSVGGSDFYPGEYQKIYTFVDTSKRDRLEAIFDGNRSGNVWTVQGDLVDELEFTASNTQNNASMGQTLLVTAGDTVTIRIKAHDPVGPNNCPLDINNPSLELIDSQQALNMPELHHIDLIASTITGNVPMTNPEDVVATDYGTDAAVIDTLYSEGNVDADGYMTFEVEIPVEESMYVRLRGTNLPASVPNETDEAGNPLPDTLANDYLYTELNPDELASHLLEGITVTTNSKLDEVAEAYADLWFYSNPIFIHVIKKDDVRTIREHLRQRASKCPECDIDGDGMITIRDARQLVHMLNAR